MPDPSEKTGFQPAPWEAGKRPTQGPAAPAGYGVPPAPPPPHPGYGAPPAPPPQSGYLGVPLGGAASDAFGGGDSGRGRTRQIPQREPQAVPQQPQGYPQQPAAQQQAYAQPPYPPQQQPYGQPQYGQPMPQYGAPPQKQTSILAILSLVALGVGVIAGLVTFGIFSAPFLFAGGILGYLGMRETAAYGRKTGRGMAVAGTISNVVLLVLNVGVLVFGFLLFQQASSELEKSMHANVDGMKIADRIRKYAEAKGDLRPGGPQFMQGYAHDTAVTGPQLTVADLVSPVELNNPIEEYSIAVIGDSATVTWNSGDGPIEVGQYTHYAGFDDGSFDSRRKPAHMPTWKFD